MQLTLVFSISKSMSAVRMWRVELRYFWRNSNWSPSASPAKWHTKFPNFHKTVNIFRRANHNQFGPHRILLNTQCPSRPHCILTLLLDRIPISVQQYDARAIEVVMYFPDETLVHVHRPDQLAARESHHRHHHHAREHHQAPDRREIEEIAPMHPPSRDYIAWTNRFYEPTQQADGFPRLRCISLFHLYCVFA